YTSYLSFTYPATTQIYTLSLHDALPISSSRKSVPLSSLFSSFRVSRSLRLSPYTLVIRIQSPLGLLSVRSFAPCAESDEFRNRRSKSTRLNSSHVSISYAVFCLKKKINI